MLTGECSNEAPLVSLPEGNVWRLVARQSRTLVALNDVRDGQPVYFVHSVSGSLTGYAELAVLLGVFNPVYGLQVPKTRMEDPALASSIEALAVQHVETLCAFQPSGSFVLGGFSAGAIIALEMAQQLTRRGRHVALLVAFDGAPSNGGGGLERWRPGYILGLLRNVPSWIRHELSTDLSGGRIVTRLFFRPIRRSDRLAAQTPARTLYEKAVSQLVMRAGLSAVEIEFIRTLYHAMAVYHPARYEGATLVFEAKTQPLLSLRQIGAAWRALADRCEVLTLPGRHTALLEAPTIYAVADTLRTALRRVDDEAVRAARPFDVVPISSADR